MAVTLLDGPMGTELDLRWVDLSAPLWSARALWDAPSRVAELHASYARAGATVHTANTFRTQPHLLPDWEAWARLAVRIARDAVPAGHRVAGSIAPLADCYRPDLSPPDPGRRHQALAEVLADAGVDLLLCETFPHVGEAWAATEAAARTGLAVWTSFTPGPDGGLLTPEEVELAARGAVDRGAVMVLVNCVAASLALPYVEALARLSVPFGVYANAGQATEGVGWGEPSGPLRYRELAASWVDAGAMVLGGCCGTSPAHVAALREAFGG